MKTYVAQAMKSSSENRHLAISLERTMLEVSDAEKELKWLRSATGSAEKEYEINQKKIAELKMELERERLGCSELQDWSCYAAITIMCSLHFFWLIQK